MFRQGGEVVLEDTDTGVCKFELFSGFGALVLGELTCVSETLYETVPLHK